jgi:hypothetical protein
MFENVPDGIVGVFTLPNAGVKSNINIRVKYTSLSLGKTIFRRCPMNTGDW